MRQATDCGSTDWKVFLALGFDWTKVLPLAEIMSNITPQQIADWFRERAVKFNEMADFTEQTFASGLVTGNQKASSEPKPLPPVKSVTQDQLEEALRLKDGRVSNVAYRLGVSENSIEQLLAEPSCKYVKGNRGWLRRKDA